MTQAQLSAQSIRLLSLATHWFEAFQAATERRDRLAMTVCRLAHSMAAAASRNLVAEFHQGEPNERDG